MADFLDKLKQGLDRGITTVGVKSKELIETQKVKGHISSIELKKRKAFEDLGAIVYSRYQTQARYGIKTSSQIAIQEMELGEWEFALFELLNNLCEGNIRTDFFEETDTDFRISASSLLNKVNEILPKLDKPQPSQWLGRVITRFNLHDGKVTKRIKGKLETIYSFNKKRVPSIIEDVTDKQRFNEETINTKFKEIYELDEQLIDKEKQLSMIHEQALKELET
jgi:hypothetical protein